MHFLFEVVLQAIAELIGEAIYGRLPRPIQIGCLTLGVVLLTALFAGVAYLLLSD